MANAKHLKVGVIGCGNISTAYFRLAPLFRGIEIVACADLKPELAKAQAKKFGLKPMSVEALIGAPDIDIVVNLTIPSAHHGVSKAVLDAGKHVYSEKPFVLSLKDGLDLKRRAEKKGLRIGSAPDTFLGGAHQLARHLVDAGAVGRITSGSCHVMNHGMEHWHPDPTFFYALGGGPVLDLGPYYIANLVQLIGPVRRVAALAATPQSERKIISKPRAGQTVKVDTPTTLLALLEFESGAAITFSASWDVWSHGHAPIELYGEKGSLFVPDPNFFGGEVRYTAAENPVKRMPAWKHPFAVANEESPHGPLANYRASGLADMAQAIIEDRPHRCSLELAIHVIEVMTAILKSGETGRFLTMTTSCERPAALDPSSARQLLVKAGSSRKAA